MELGHKISEGIAVDVPDFIPSWEEAGVEFVSADTMAAMERVIATSVPHEEFVPVFED